MSSACFRNALLIGRGNASDINQLTFDWKAGCWDCSVCRKSLNYLKAGNPKLKFCLAPRDGCNRLGEIRLLATPAGTWAGRRGRARGAGSIRGDALPCSEQFPF